MAAQDGHLLLGESSSTSGDDVLNPPQKDGDAVHLTLDQKRVFELTNRGASLVEIEEDRPLGVERRLRRVDVLCAGLVAGLKRSRSEGNHAAALVGDGKHHAFAEAVVDGTQAAIPLFLRAEKAAGAQS